MSTGTSHTERHQRVKALFLDALDQPEASRAAWLDATCHGDADLRAEVLALLEAHDDAEDTGRLDEPLLQRPAEPATDPLLGRSIGPWRLIEQIGTGGMGAVYRAERDAGDYERTVAVKLLRPGGNLDALARRLYAERRLLARLEHPHIARLYDGGVTTDGFPYLALEYVEGASITTHTTTHGLGLRERLALFLQVCDAVAYAHRSLIIHRDLKPSNILVTETEGAPSVRLLDFGIAKLLDEEDESTATRTELAALTPAYAAPEQVRGQPITTATDVYGLGVVLYEMLAGQRPYDLLDKTATEIEHIVCAQMPPRPSVHDPRLRGDLDTIVLKALAKEPERRYASAEALADDLRRYLDGLPVLARPATARYRIRKFAARHRLGVATAAALLLALLGGLGTTLWQARVAAQERDRAERRFAVAREAAGAMLYDIHSAVARVPGTTAARELIASTSLTYLNRLAAEAMDDADLRLDLAEAYRHVGDVLGNPVDDNLGRTDEALKSYARGLALVPHFPPTDSLAGRADHIRAKLYEEQGTVEAFAGNLDSALISLDSALAAFHRSTTHDPDNLDWRVQYALGHINRGDYTGHPHVPNMGQPDSALAHYEQAQVLLESIGEHERGDGTRRILGLVFERMGTLYLERSEYDAALDAYQRSLVFREQLGHRDGASTEEIRDLGVAYEKVGLVYWNQGNPREALIELERAAAIYQQLAEVDPQSVRAQHTLAVSHMQRGDVKGGPEGVTLNDRAAALQHYDDALALLRPLTADSANVYVPGLIGDIQRRLAAMD